MRRYLAVGLLLMSGAARASEPVYRDGVPPSDLTFVDQVAPVLSSIGHVLLVLAPLPVFFGVLVALDWAARAAWRAVMKTQPPFGFYSVSAIVIALVLGAVGVFVVPAFAQLFESFGADLPTPTGLLMHYRALLAILVVPLLALLYRLRASPRREAYFAAILACEMCLLVLSVVALYLPVFSMSEAV